MELWTLVNFWLELRENPQQTLVNFNGGDVEIQLELGGGTYGAVWINYLCPYLSYKCLCIHCFYNQIGNVLMKLISYKF